MKKKNTKLTHVLATIPSVPGVYLMKDSGGEVIYVGKAANLRTRVRSYFNRRADMPKIEVLKTRIADIEYIATPTEVEALLLEATLVARYDPRYNTLLKDDKSYPLLKITREKYPRIAVTRDKRDTHAQYYGPYTDARLLRQAVGLINSIFPIRKCRRLPKRACLYYFLKQCLGPCVDPSVGDEYARNITEIEEFLKGSKKSFIAYLSQRMEEASAKYKYEEAARFKEQIQALETIRLKRFRHYDPTRSISLSGSLELKRVLGLKKVPQRIVCLDVSNTSGTHAVASKVSFFRELPDTDEYRRFKIRESAAIDDYRMIGEALRRMIRSLKEKREKNVPDLIMIDGGKGHLQSALRVLDTEGCTHIPVIALAKRFEQVYCPSARDPVPLVEGGLAHNLLRRIRDEAHRFAITYHRSMRAKSMQLSVLDQVKGIGPQRKKTLLAQYPSIEAIRHAAPEKIAELPGFNRSIAKILLKTLNKPLSRQ